MEKTMNIMVVDDNHDLAISSVCPAHKPAYSSLRPGTREDGKFPPKKLREMTVVTSSKGKRMATRGEPPG